MKFCLFLAIPILNLSLAAAAEPAPSLRAHYLPPEPYVSRIDESLNLNSQSLIQEGYSILPKQPLTAPLTSKDFPLCVHLSAPNDPAIQKATQDSLDRWNQIAQKTVNKNAFELNCSKPKEPLVEILYSPTSGKEKDGQIEFGEMFYLKGPKFLLLLRKKEMTDFISLLNLMGEKTVLEKQLKGPNRTQFENSFAKYKQKKISIMINQIITHELGHVLGLGHNFNNEEKSVMNYSDLYELSDYDKDAFVFLFNPSKKSSTKWNAQNKLPQ